MRNFIPVFLLFLAVFAGCGSNDNDGLTGIYSVNDINILANDIEVGESVRTEVFFETKVETDGSPDGLELVVRIPAELSYEIGSSRIYDGSTDNSDSRTPDDVVLCETGETFLVYNFDDSELFDRAISGANNYGIRFELRGVSPVNLTRVGASAGESEEFICGENFPAEKDEAVTVL